MIALLLITDGRLDYLEQTMRSLHNLDGKITEFWMYDDSGDAEHRAELRDLFPKFIHINRGPRQGFAGAIHSAWNTLANESVAQFVFHVEADFTFDRRVDLSEMAAVMAAHPYLAQICLRRQPWNEAEKVAGGIIEQWPNEYRDREWEGSHWLEHRLFVSTNPALWKMSRIKQGWPVCEQSERVYSEQVFMDKQARSAFWGTRDSGVWVTHVGQHRAGVGY